jgi:hypothetical protein
MLTSFTDQTQSASMNFGSIVARIFREIPARERKVVRQPSSTRWWRWALQAELMPRNSSEPKPHGPLFVEINRSFGGSTENEIAYIYSSSFPVLADNGGPGG